MTEVELLSQYGGGKQVPNRIIIHSMGEYIFEDDNPIPASQFLHNKGFSAHILVSPTGSLIRLRMDDQRAHHAKGYNKDSLGVEFLVEGQHSYATFKERIKENWLTKEQFQIGVSLLKTWCEKWNIQSILRHSDVSPERKIDPGSGFPFEKMVSICHINTL